MNGAFLGHLRTPERLLTCISFVVEHGSEQEPKGQDVSENIPGDIALAHNSTLHQRLPLTADPLKPPAWKRLISSTVAPHERVALITGIFSDQKEVETIRNLCGDDAQTFVDLIDEVRRCPLSPLECE